MQIEKTFSRYTWIFLLAGLAGGLALGGLLFLWSPGSLTVNLPEPGAAAGRATATPAPAPIIGAPAPDFTLTDLAGQTVTLSAYRGQVVLLNFWATWCGPCQAEMPALQQQYAAFKDKGLALVAVNAGEPRADVENFVRAAALTFPVLLDPRGPVNDLYRINALPTTFIINREGVITHLRVGMLAEEQLTAYLEEEGLR